MRVYSNTEPPSPQQPTSTLSYQSQKGETLSKVSQMLGVPVEVLQQYNPKLKDANKPLPEGTDVALPRPKGHNPPGKRHADGTVDEKIGYYLGQDYPQAKHKPAHHTETAAKARAAEPEMSPSDPAAHEAPPPVRPHLNTSAGAASAEASLTRARFEQHKPAPPTPSLSERAETGAAQVVEESKKVFGARDTMDTVKAGTDALLHQAKGLQAAAETKVASLTSRLEQFSKEAKACVRELAMCKDPKLAAQLGQKMEGIWKGSAAARSELAAAGKELAGLEKQTAMLAKEAGKAEEVAEFLGKTKSLKSAAMKAFAPLEAMGMYLDYEKANPGHPAQNLIKAATAFTGKYALDLKTAGSKLNIAETAVGAVKFGMEMIGLKDTPPYDVVDTISQAFPMDAVARGLGAGVDIAAASWDYVRGDAQKMDQLFDANMSGKNGLMMQGLQVLSDLMITGGKNIPQDPESLKFSYLFYNDGHTEVPLSQTGRNPKEKIRLLQQVMEGDKTAPNDVQKIQQILGRARPQDLDEIFVKINGLDLAHSLQPGGQTKDPAIATFLDLARIAGTAHGGQPEAMIWKDLDLFLSGLDIQGRKQVFDELRSHVDQGHLKQIPGWLQQRIRWQYGQ